MPGGDNPRRGPPSAILDRAGLLQTLKNGYRLHWEGIHGLPHWHRVYAVGTYLAPLCGADQRIVELFALLHDCRRLNDGDDPGHGHRAAEFARDANGGFFRLEKPALDRLYIACRDHNSGQLHDDVTIQCCWDADRLDLPRVGVRPRKSYLGTEPARKLLDSPMRYPYSRLCASEAKQPVEEG